LVVYLGERNGDDAVFFRLGVSAGLNVSKLSSLSLMARLSIATSEIEALIDISSSLSLSLSISQPRMPRSTLSKMKPPEKRAVRRFLPESLHLSGKFRGSACHLVCCLSIVLEYSVIDVLYESMEMYN